MNNNHLYLYHIIPLLFRLPVYHHHKLQWLCKHNSTTDWIGNNVDNNIINIDDIASVTTNKS
jgi:hypothetical protein